MTSLPGGKSKSSRNLYGLTVGKFLRQHYGGHLYPTPQFVEGGGLRPTLGIYPPWKRGQKWPTYLINGWWGYLSTLCPACNLPGGSGWQLLETESLADSRIEALDT